MFAGRTEAVEQRSRPLPSGRRGRRPGTLAAGRRGGTADNPLRPPERPCTAFPGRRVLRPAPGRDRSIWGMPCNAGCIVIENRVKRREAREAFTAAVSREMAGFEAGQDRITAGATRPAACRPRPSPDGFCEPPETLPTARSCRADAEARPMEQPGAVDDQHRLPRRVSSRVPGARFSRQGERVTAHGIKRVQGFGGGLRPFRRHQRQPPARSGTASRPECEPDRRHQAGVGGRAFVAVWRDSRARAQLVKPDPKGGRLRRSWGATRTQPPVLRALGRSEDRPTCNEGTAGEAKRCGSAGGDGLSWWVVCGRWVRRTTARSLPVRDGHNVVR